MEEKLIEEEVARRVEELVAQRVEAELERRKEEIEAEVMRRVEEAKKTLEKQMMEEMERQRAAELEAQAKKEVKYDTDGLFRSAWHNFSRNVSTMITSKAGVIRTSCREFSWIVFEILRLGRFAPPSHCPCPFT